MISCYCLIHLNLNKVHIYINIYKYLYLVSYINNGLYVVHCTTITGFARVSSFDDKDTTKLWHMS